MRFRKFILDYFSFSRGERRGIIVLLLLIILTLFGYISVPYLFTPLKFSPSYLDSIMSVEMQNLKKESSIPNSFFRFDPNVISKSALDSLSLPKKVKSNLLAYREKGGRFYKPGDFRKIYGMTDSVFNRISPYIDIKVSKSDLQMEWNPNRKIEDRKVDTIRSKERNGAHYSSGKLLLIEINSATVKDFSHISGIGKVLSARIVKFRNILGGFSSVNQLYEVYGLDSGLVNRNRYRFDIDTKRIEKHDINLENIPELAKHPYISWKVAKKIVDYRTKNGYIKDLLQLKRDSVFNDSLWQKLSPYLEIKE